MADQSGEAREAVATASGADDAELARRFAAGDEAAWALLLERYTDLVYRTALEYAGHGPDREDEAAELYLFMAELVRRSLASFRGRCQVKTWIVAVIGNRRHVLKAYLLRKDPGRADVRLPRVLQGRPETEKEIYRRLVWGMEAEHIALELGVSAGHCAEVEALVARASPRVHARIRANRLAQAPRVSLDADLDETGSRPRLQVAGPGPGPLESLEQRDLEALVRQGLETAYAAMEVAERRVLLLMLNHGLTAAEVVAAAHEGDLSLAEVDGTNRCYYLKDRALGRLVRSIRARLDAAGYATSGEVARRELLQRVEELLREIGVPEEQP